MKSFGELFKYYRFKSEFFRLSDFANALADKGLIYDLSVFSMWQKGQRIPTRRQILITMVSLFIECGAIISVDQANEFLESAGHGYLTKNEQQLLLNLPY